jgi:beta-galactosidase GanA
MDKSPCKLYTLAVYIVCVLTTLCAVPSDGADQSYPIAHLREQGNATQLIVDGKPFLVLGGELGNSSTSSLDYMKPFWPKLVKLNLNTILAPVYWDLIEPEEGKFDFTLVDGLIQDARHYNLRLVLLWFASWKNSMSCYAPVWVKTSQERFPRAQDKNGKGMEILSAFSSKNRDADARAFAALMRHIREVDKKKHTVIMVQVENEVGMKMVQPS